LPLFKETEIVNQLFKNGLEVFHLRKHNFTREQMEGYINQIYPEFHRNIILHSHAELVEKYKLKGIHFSTLIPEYINTRLQQDLYKSTFCYTLPDISSRDAVFDQIIIGPIFKSISNPMYYNRRYNHCVLQQFFEEHALKSKIIAIGGIDETSAKIALSIGFKGIVALGSIWTTYLETIDIEKTITKFNRIKETCLQVCN